MSQTQWTDEAVRDRVFDYHSAELSELDRTQIDEHLEHHPDTAMFYARVGETLDAAVAYDEPMSADARDAVFDGITQEIGGFEEQPASRNNVQWVAFGAAVAAAAAAAALVFLPPPDTAPLPLEPAPVEASVADASLQGLQGTEDVLGATRLFASVGATYLVSSDDGDVVIELDSGTLLIEFVPDTEDARLRVRAPDAEVEVLGTVFYVDVQAGRSEVGVMEGSVEVGSDDQTNVRLDAGTRLRRDRDLGPISSSQRTTVDETYIDLAAHTQALAERALALAPPREQEADEPQEDEPSTERVEGSDSTEPEIEIDLRELADEAMEDGDYERAAGLLERHLEDIPAYSSRAQYVYLDLSRLYLRFLERPESAEIHLRTFLMAWPDDPAAASAREEYCELSGAHIAICER